MFIIEVLARVFIMEVLTLFEKMFLLQLFKCISYQIQPLIRMVVVILILDFVLCFTVCLFLSEMFTVLTITRE